MKLVSSGASDNRAELSVIVVPNPRVIGMQKKPTSHLIE